MNNETSYFFIPDYQFQKYFYVSVGNNFFTVFVEAPRVVEAVCPPLNLALVTNQCSAKTDKRRIMQTTPHNSPDTLVFWCQRSSQNSTGVTPSRWGRPKIGDFVSTLCSSWQDFE